MLLSSVFKIFNYRQKEKCPEDSQLYLFAKGQSDKKIEQHIKGCPDCSETLRLIQESHSVTNAIGFKEPDLRIPELRGKLENFLAQYAKPEPVAVQFTKKIAQFQLKEKVEGLIEEILDKKWLITPPSLELAGAVRSETGVAPWADEEDIHRGTLSGEKYSLKIQYIPQADGKEQIELQIRPKPNENVAFSQLTVKIVNSKGEVLVSKLAPFFDEAGIATLEIPDELSEGEYAIVVE